MSLTRLRGLFYCEFDTVAGPRVTFQAREGVLDELGSDAHEAVHIITRPQLSGKLVTITAAGARIMGAPVTIRSERYPRNALLFSVGCVLDEDTDTWPYRPLLRKLSRLLLTLELESSFLFEPERKVGVRVSIHRIACG
jgi:nitrogen permease regulator 2-like protein